MASLKKALLLTVASNGTAMVLQLVVVMVLSRLLTPAEVGVYSVAAVLSGLAGMVRDFGVGEYLIQEKDLDDAKIRAAITANLMTSWSVCAILFLASGPVAAFYGEPGVGQVLSVLALSFVVIPFGAVAMAFHRREMRFQPMYWATLASGVGSGLVSIVLALSGFGAMSLAWGSVAGSLLIVLVSIALRPRGFPFLPGLKGLGTVVRFGTHLTGTYVFAHVARGVPDLVIGRLMDMASVGLFSRAGGAIELIHRFVLRGIRPAMLPYYSAQRREGVELRTGFLKSVTMLTGVTWPAIALLGLMAWPAIRLMYGGQWLAAVPVMQVLCAAFAVEVVFLTVSEVVIAAGAVAPGARLQAAILAVRVGAVVAGAFFGLLGVGCGLLGAAVVAAVLNVGALRRTIGVGWADVAAACRPSLVPALVAALPATGVLLAVRVGEDNYLAAALLAGFGGAAGWLAVMLHGRHPLGTEVRAALGAIAARITRRRRP